MLPVAQVKTAGRLGITASSGLLSRPVSCGRAERLGEKPLAGASGGVGGQTRGEEGRPEERPELIVAS